MRLRLDDLGLHPELLEAAAEDEELVGRGEALPPQCDADMRHLLRALSGEEKLTSSAS